MFKEPKKEKKKRDVEQGAAGDSDKKNMHM